MVTDEIESTAQKIRKVEIQGATTVARSAVSSLLSLLDKEFSSFQDFSSSLSSAVDLLASTRPTEPAMRNSLKKVSSLSSDSLPSAKLELKKNVEIFLESQAKVKKTTAEAAASLIEDGDTIFTHCHSSTVISGMLEAQAQGKKFKVFCTETRPLYQGRITARELNEAGIPTTIVVDSASSMVLPRTSKAMVGVDAIEWDGTLLNKIGTFLVSIFADYHAVPLYAVTESYKFDPTTQGGKTPLEFRPPEEVWDQFPALNPAFDRTPPHFIDAYVTEFGVLSPDDLLPKLRELYSSLK